MKPMSRWMALLLLLLLPLSGWAQQQVVTPTITDYQAPHQDASVQMLFGIFGSANGIFGDGNGGWFGDALFALNLGIMSVAIAWFSWNVVSAVVQGSFDGEFLGKRQSTIWVPIRTVTGMALLAPVWSGWSLAQLSMAWATVIGVGIANSVAGHIPASSFPLATPVANIPRAAAIMDKMQPGWRCILEKRLDIKRNLGSQTDADEPSLYYNWDSRTYTKGLDVGVNYGVIPARENKTETSCGQMGFMLGDATGEADNIKTAVALANSTLSTVITGMDADLKALYQYASSVEDPDDTASQAVMAKLIKTQQQEIVTRWQAHIDSAMQSLIASDQEKTKAAVQAAITKHGWLGAGAAGATSVIDAVKASSKSPSAKGGDDQNAIDSCSPGEFVGSPQICTEKTINEVTVEPMRRVSDEYQIIDVIADNGGPFTTAPILGNRILDFVTGMFNLSVGLVIAAGAFAMYLALIPGVTISTTFLLAAMNVISFYFGVFFLIAIPLVIFSVQLIVMIPATIMVAWIFAVGAWLVIVAESIVASPLWAMAHLDTDGEGMGQRTAHGYIFYLNLLFRPAIIVIVVGFAYAFAEALGTFANEILKGFVTGLISGKGYNFVKEWILLAAGLWLIVTVNLKVAGVSASLLTIIPNQIFTWIGGQFGSNVGSGVEGDVTDKFNRGTQSAGEFLSKKMGPVSSEVKAGMEGRKETPPTKPRMPAPSKVGAEEGEETKDSAQSGITRKAGQE